MIKRKYFIGIVFLVGFVSTSFAENDLGSPKEAHSFFTKDYSKGVEIAFPRYQTQRLQAKLKVIAARHSRGSSRLKVSNLKELAATFKIRLRDSRGEYFEDKQNTLEAISNLGKMYMHKNQDNLGAMSMTAAKRELPNVRRLHIDTMKKIGINPQQLLFFQTDFMLMQGRTNPKLSNQNKETPVVVDSTFSYGLRQIEGIMVEESHVKLFSKNQKSVGTLDTVWPTFKFHPRLRSFALQSKQALMKSILQKVKMATRGNEVSIKMAVVLKPVKVERKVVFVPALKVGIMPTNGEAGELFYVDLNREKAQYQNEETSDKRSSRTIGRIPGRVGGGVLRRI
ncbi:MAG: hypothetical protein ISR65_09600 [Bacteriovoracaceae bacterium]|nr:hypothetical protein [Bacteriovoracaceae bacterium]